MKSTHIRITEADYEEFKMLARFQEWKSQEPITKQYMMTILLKTFRDQNVDAINVMNQSVKKVAQLTQGDNLNGKDLHIIESR